MLLPQLELVSELARGVEPPCSYSLEDRSLGVAAVMVVELMLLEQWKFSYLFVLV